MPKSKRKKRSPKRVLRLPDLEQTKSAVINSLTSKSGQRSYDHAITEFVDWYAQSRGWHSTALLCFGTASIPNSGMAATRINLRLAAVRSVAYEAADSGQLTQNWRPAFVGSKAFGELAAPWKLADCRPRSIPALGCSPPDLRSKRNYAILALLLGCGPSSRRGSRPHHC
jgi:hypothetical protein